LAFQRLEVAAAQTHHDQRRLESAPFFVALSRCHSPEGLEEKPRRRLLCRRDGTSTGVAKIKELIARRTDAASVAEIIRDRLHAKYDTDEIRQSWLTLAEADPMSLIRVFCHLPFRADGRTDPIART